MDPATSGQIPSLSPVEENILRGHGKQESEDHICIQAA
jgi:hypothetical protein